MSAAPYPSHWEADVLLRDGSTVRVRPIRPSDASALQAFHVAQSEESTYLRFFAPLKVLPERELTRLVTVDHTDRVALVALAGDAIIAVGRYDRLEATRAEVAFNVSDAHQGRGLGSVLLEHLAAAARERGIATFVADVLPGNARMIRVFQEAGYEVTQRYENGVIALAFDIASSPRWLQVLAEREHRTDAASMRAFLAPGRILVMAGGTSAPLAARVARNLAGLRVTCVGESLRDVARECGHAWRASLAELDDVAARLARIGEGPGVGPDGRGAQVGPSGGDEASAELAELAVLDAPPQDVIHAMTPLAARGVRGAVVLSDGFDAPGCTRADLVRAARGAGVRIVGPGSFGVLTTGAGGRINATLGTDAPASGTAALFCQSGALGLELTALAAEHGLGVSTFISSGQRADVSGNDLLQYALYTEGTRAVGLYLESLGNARKFARVVSRLAQQVPVVAVVGAGQREGQEGELGRRGIEEAAGGAGVVVAPTMRAMVEATQLFTSQPLPRGDRIAVLSGSASVAELALAQVAHLDPTARATVLSPYVEASRLASAVAALAADSTWDAALVHLATPLGAPDAAVLAALAGLADSARPVCAVVPGLRGLRPELTSPAGVTIPAYECIEDAVAALTHACTYARWRRTDRGELAQPGSVDVPRARTLIAGLLEKSGGAGRLELHRRDVRELLTALGIDVMRSIAVSSTGDALLAARELGWPVVVKAIDPALRHRADLGAIRLGVGGPIELVDAVRQVRHRQGGGRVVVQAEAPPGVACTVRGWVDPLLGPVVSFGLAGDATELLGDATYAVPPLHHGDVHRLVHGVRAAPRLMGHGGTPSVDIPALEDLVARVAYALEVLPQLHVLEIRPALAAHKGVVALDAQVVLAREGRPDPSRRALA